MAEIGIEKHHWRRRYAAWAAALLVILPVSARAERRLSLAEALATATARRSELKQADVDILRARVGLLRARLERVHLTVQASFTEQVQALNVNAPRDYVNYVCQASDDCRAEAHSFVGGANLTVPIFSGLQVESDIARAHALVRSADAQRRAVLLAIVVEVVDSYWTVRRADLTHALLERALQRELEIEQNTKARVDAGIAPSVDYYRAHVQVLRQQSQIQAIAEQRDAALAEFGAVLQIDDAIVLTEQPPESAPPLPALDGAQQAALEARPELRVAKAQLEAQQQAVRAAKGAYWPQFSLVGAATLQNQSLFYPESQSNKAQVIRNETMLGNFFLGAQLNWTVFDMLTTYLNVKDAAHVRDRLEHDLERQRYVVLAGVAATWQRLRHEVDRLSIVEATAKVAQDTIDTLRKRYKVGSAAIFELTAAEDQLVAVESDLIATRIAIAQAEAELRAAIGQL
jgi:outer membrane protein TolC